MRLWPIRTFCYGKKLSLWFLGQPECTLVPRFASMLALSVAVGRWSLSLGVVGCAQKVVGRPLSPSRPSATDPFLFPTEREQVRRRTSVRILRSYVPSEIKCHAGLRWARWAPPERATSDRGHPASWSPGRLRRGSPVGSSRVGAEGRWAAPRCVAFDGGDGAGTTGRTEKHVVPGAHPPYARWCFSRPSHDL